MCAIRPKGACLGLQAPPVQADGTRNEVTHAGMPEHEPTAPTPISRKLDENAQEMRTRLGIGISFDILERPLEIGGRRALCYFVDGFIKDKVTADIFASLQETERGEIVPNVVRKLLARRIPYFEVDTVDSIEKAVQSVMAGPLVLFVDQEDTAIAIDVREFPTRSIEEPDLEKVTRGSHEGLAETLVFNTAMIRRRLRDPRLRFEIQQVGRRSRTDVAVGYIADIADHGLVDQVKQRIREASVDALPMGVKNLEEIIVKSPWNPLPKVRYTERPDVAIAHLLEGHVIVLVDTTPMAMILPVTFFHFFEHAEEFFQSPPIGTYLRWVRATAFVVATVLTPLWLALYLSKPALPQWLQFVGPQETSVVPVWLQFFILELGIDLIRMALIHTPTALATSLGIVGAILLGDLAVTVGLFVPETVLYTAVTSIGYFAIPSLEFAYCLRLYRYCLLALAALFRLPGLAAGLVAGFLALAFTRSMNVPYLFPLIPFHGPSLVKALFRLPVPAVGQRPPLIGNRQSDRTRTQGEGAGDRGGAGEAAPARASGAQQDGAAGTRAPSGRRPLRRRMTNPRRPRVLLAPRKAGSSSARSQPGDD